MKTRRSRKSFEMPPRKIRKKQRRSSNKGKPLKAVNETIVLSDSDTEQEQVTNTNICNDDDIEVIEVLDVTQRVEENEEILLGPEEDDPPLGGSSEDPPPPSTPVDQCDVVDVNDSEPSSSSTDNVSSIPVVDVDEDSTSAPENPPNDDDDGVEFLGFVVTHNSKRRRSQGAASRPRKSNGNLQIMQDSIKKAKDLVRRSSSNNSAKTAAPNSTIPIAARSGTWHGLSLNTISFNSRQINRQKRKNKQQQKKQFKNPFRPAQKWNALNRNRARENGREILLRPLEFAPPANYNVQIPRNEGVPWVHAKTFQDRSGPPPIPVGSNIMMANDTASATNRAPGSLRPVVIDGSNIAVGHGDMSATEGHRFSPRGIQICVEYFRKRGHTEVIAFVPRFRLKLGECRDPRLLETLERDGCVRFTPSREAGRHRITSYDDLFVIQYAHETGGIIISNDNFRDIYRSNLQLQETITLRQLMFTWVTPDVIMFPQDPLGAGGPTLDEFLKF